MEHHDPVLLEYASTVLWALRDRVYLQHRPLRFHARTCTARTRTCGGRVRQPAPTKSVP